VDLDLISLVEQTGEPGRDWWRILVLKGGCKTFRSRCFVAVGGRDIADVQDVLGGTSTREHAPNPTIMSLVIPVDYGANILERTGLRLSSLPSLLSLMEGVRAATATESGLLAGQVPVTLHTTTIGRLLPWRSWRLPGLPTLVGALTVGIAVSLLKPEKLLAAVQAVATVGDRNADFQVRVVRWQRGHVEAGLALEPAPATTALDSLQDPWETLSAFNCYVSH